MKENQERKAKMVDGFAQPQDVPVPNFAGYPEKNVKIEAKKATKHIKNKFNVQT